MKKIAAILITLLLFSSCRQMVVEERMDCPRFLFFDIRNADSFNTYDPTFLTVSSHPESSLSDDAESTVHAVQDQDFFFTVQGTEAVKGYGLIGYEKLNRRASEWTAPLGQDYAPLFRFSYLEPTQEESFVVPAEFVKEYCHLTIQFTGTDTYASTDGVFPFDIVVKSQTCGIDAMSGIPVRGPFEVHPKEQTQGFFEMTLPRLADQQLNLELYGREGVSSHPGHNNTLNLYAILADEGITWKEKNLPDIDIRINYQELTIGVKVYPWAESLLTYEY